MERLFEATLHGCSTTELEEGFRDFFAEPREKVFFPKPGEIQFHISRARERRAFENQADSTDKYLDDLRRTREKLKADGQAYGPEQFNQIMRKAAETIDRMKQTEEVSPVKRREYLEAQRRELMARKKA